jgi:hypothetical protein
MVFVSLALLSQTTVDTDACKISPVLPYFFGGSIRCAGDRGSGRGVFTGTAQIPDGQGMTCCASAAFRADAVALQPSAGARVFEWFNL